MKQNQCVINFRFQCELENLLKTFNKEEQESFNHSLCSIMKLLLDKKDTKPNQKLKQDFESLGKTYTITYEFFWLLMEHNMKLEKHLCLQGLTR
ncbi:hypothetical protein [Helicobacter cetorum]|uniref:Uncharacterized protein n=2 Tax=Helicobacter cetorum TaxID=138563 RepID=I0EPL5_HELC0|nr:hypothetical protein [Helicobacter cetorum]ABS86817.1 hypothetical protein pz20w [Helicobacter cetorum]AFI04139.1 hypothetical protein HCW_04350 [Helicobacter cetorum MIT 00-7128]AFI04884.1 hypothetical protein HCW_08135 [Helicobacter cetorum MIT 00-7128]